jgi:hypothetical protein
MRLRPTSGIVTSVHPTVRAISMSAQPRPPGLIASWAGVGHGESQFLRRGLTVLARLLLRRLAKPAPAAFRPTPRDPK